MELCIVRNGNVIGANQLTREIWIMSDRNRQMKETVKERWSISSDAGGRPIMLEASFGVVFRHLENSFLGMEKRLP